MTPSPTFAVLDNVVFTSLTGRHAWLAQHQGHAVRYPADVSPFAALPDRPQQRDWNDLAQVTGPEGVALTGVGAEPPNDWKVLSRFGVVQMVTDDIDAEDDGEAVRLSTGDVPEMLDLAGRTDPGPFAQRTIDMGTYLGFRQAGQLIAMAGQRFRPPGWTEISAVCTAPEFRGRGLATRLIGALAAEIRRSGDAPFLHVAASNGQAIALYESLGFKTRRTTELLIVRPQSWSTVG